MREQINSDSGDSFQGLLGLDGLPMQRFLSS
jgi:hypothetical protein